MVSYLNVVFANFVSVVSALAPRKEERNANNGRDRRIPVMSSPRGQNFGLGLGLEALASAWPRLVVVKMCAEFKNKDVQTTCDHKTTLCTIVHHAVKIQHML